MRHHVKYEHDIGFKLIRKADGKRGSLEYDSLAKALVAKKKAFGRPEDDITALREVIWDLVGVIDDLCEERRELWRRFNLVEEQVDGLLDGIPPDPHWCKSQGRIRWSCYAE
jgi:hypothetical protein